MEKRSRNKNYGLPPEEVNELIKQYQETEDDLAQSRLVENYTKLVESLAYRYSRGQSHHEDLVQVGMLGLLGAIRRFDTSFERRFEVFLVPAPMCGARIVPPLSSISIEVPSQLLIASFPYGLRYMKIE